MSAPAVQYSFSERLPALQQGGEPSNPFIDVFNSEHLKLQQDAQMGQVLPSTGPALLQATYGAPQGAEPVEQGANTVSFEARSSPPLEPANGAYSGPAYSTLAYCAQNAMSTYGLYGACDPEGANSMPLESPLLLLTRRFPVVRLTQGAHERRILAIKDNTDSFAVQFFTLQGEKSAEFCLESFSLNPDADFERNLLTFRQKSLNLLQEYTRLGVTYQISTTSSADPLDGVIFDFPVTFYGERERATAIFDELSGRLFCRQLDQLMSQFLESTNNLYNSTIDAYKTDLKAAQLSPVEEAITSKQFSAVLLGWHAKRLQCTFKRCKDHMYCEIAGEKPMKAEFRQISFNSFKTDAKYKEMTKQMLEGPAAQQVSGLDKMEPLQFTGGKKPFVLFFKPTEYKALCQNLPGLLKKCAIINKLKSKSSLGLEKHSGSALLSRSTVQNTRGSTSSLLSRSSSAVRSMSRSSVSELSVQRSSTTRASSSRRSVLENDSPRRRNRDQQSISIRQIDRSSVGQRPPAAGASIASRLSEMATQRSFQEDESRTEQRKCKRSSIHGVK